MARKKKTNIRRNLLIGAVVIAFGVIMFSSGLLQQIAQDRYVEIPFSASVECQQAGTSKTLIKDISERGEWISDDLPTNTNEWNIILRGEGGITGKRFEYYICPSRTFCSNRQFAQFSSSGGSKSLGLISSDMHVWVQYQTFSFGSWKEFDKGSYTLTYKPFRLIRDDPLRGGRQEISDTCIIPTSDPSWQNRITKYDGTENWKTWGGSNSLRPGDFYNYITANVVAVTEGNLQDGGWCFFENGQARIFAIETIETASGNHNRVNLDNQIGSAECCNREAIPGGICQDGKFIPTEEAECGTRADCGIIEWSPGETSTEARRPQCIENKCVFETKEVDCTLDSQCRTGEFCSRNTFTCEIAGDVGDGGEERTGEMECRFWETLRPGETTRFLGLFETDKPERCETANWVWVLGAIILIGGFFGIRMRRKK